MEFDPYHDLLTTRYVCEACLTRYFSHHHICLACKRHGRIRPLINSLYDFAGSDSELRTIIAQGQTIYTPYVTTTGSEG